MGAMFLMLPILISLLIFEIFEKHELVSLKPQTLATGHGTTFVGNGEQALRDLEVVMCEALA